MKRLLCIFGLYLLAAHCARATTYSGTQYFNSNNVVVIVNPATNPASPVQFQQMVAIAGTNGNRLITYYFASTNGTGTGFCESADGTTIIMSPGVPFPSVFNNTVTFNQPVTFNNNSTFSTVINISSNFIIGVTTDNVTFVRYETNFLYLVISTNAVTTNTVNTIVNIGGTVNYTNAAYVLEPHFKDTGGGNLVFFGTLDFTGTSIIGLTPGDGLTTNNVKGLIGLANLLTNNTITINGFALTNGAAISIVSGDGLTTNNVRGLIGSSGLLSNGAVTINSVLLSNGANLTITSGDGLTTNNVKGLIGAGTALNAANATTLVGVVKGDIITNGSVTLNGNIISNGANLTLTSGDSLTTNNVKGIITGANLLTNNASQINGIGITNGGNILLAAGDGSGNASNAIWAQTAQVSSNAIVFDYTIRSATQTFGNAAAGYQLINYTYPITNKASWFDGTNLTVNLAPCHIEVAAPFKFTEANAITVPDRYLFYAISTLGSTVLLESVSGGTAIANTIFQTFEGTFEASNTIEKWQFKIQMVDSAGTFTSDNTNPNGPIANRIKVRVTGAK